VSSTVVDLQPERQAVYEWLRKARHQAVDSYLPDSDTVQVSCLADVDTCDLYVLILGHRYGYPPPEDNPEGLSITHLEYRRAGQAGIPRIVLMRASIPDERQPDIDDPDKWARVRAFRAEVALGHSDHGDSAGPAQPDDRGLTDIQPLSGLVAGQKGYRGHTLRSAQVL
jgi:hypothetical protein